PKKRRRRNAAHGPGAGTCQGIERPARDRRYRADRPDGRVLEGVRPASPPEISLGGMNVLKEIESHDLKAVRFSFADQHGVLRGKTLAAAEAKNALERGVTLTSTLILKDTSHRTVYPAFTPGGGVGMPEMQGAADILLKPDESTFRLLPWAPDTGWLLCDAQFHDGRPVPYCTRGILRDALRKFKDF